MLPLDIPAARCYSDIWQVCGSAGLLNTDNRNKGATGFRQPKECRSGLDCGISYAAMLFISCTMRSCSVSSSSKRSTCIRTFSVKPSAFASFAGDTFLNLSSENTISLAMAISPFHVSKHFLWDKMFLSLSSISIIAKAWQKSIDLVLYVYKKMSRLLFFDTFYFFLSWLLFLKISEKNFFRG